MLYNVKRILLKEVEIMSPRKSERKAPRKKRGETYEDFIERYTKYKLETQKGFDVYEDEVGKYFCFECRTEVPFLQNCPVCKKIIDWNKVVLAKN